MNDDELVGMVRAHFNKVRGRCAGLIESWGLDERRERAMITTLKNLTYDAENSLVELLEENE